MNFTFITFIFALNTFLQFGNLKVYFFLLFSKQWNNFKVKCVTRMVCKGGGMRYIQICLGCFIVLFSIKIEQQSNKSTPSAGLSSGLSFSYNTGPYHDDL